MDFAYLGTVLLLVFGFGFVIFWHELGHFLAAKWAGVKVEQFAVGFGQAMLSWRQGLGTRWGSSREEYERLARDYLRQNEVAIKSARDLSEAPEERRLDYAAAQLGLGETEYRLNWIPLGGYVKMLGQDDLNPNAISDNPRAYNNKPISKRIVIVSAGVVMNVILAIILFSVLFRIGFNVPPAVVGVVLPNSPAQQAGFQVGDKVLEFDQRVQHDFTKISLNVALVEEGQPVPVLVQRPDGTKKRLTVMPRQSDIDPMGFLQLGIAPSFELRGIDAKGLTPEAKAELAETPVQPGEKIVAINGQPVGLKDYYKLDRALQDGRPVQITVEDAQGRSSQRTVQPRFLESFGKTPLNFAGMVPRATVERVMPGSSAQGKLKHGDIIEEVTIQPANDAITAPTRQKLMDALNGAGQNDYKVDIVVLRDGKRVSITGLVPNVRVAKDRKGLGIQLAADEEHPVIADVLPDSAAARAKIPTGATIAAIDGQAVADWHDVQRILAGSSDKPLQVAVTTGEGQSRSFEMQLSPEQLAAVRANHYASDLILHELTEPRQTKNPLTAAAWGVTETRDLMVQFYLTLRRMIQGSVPASGAMGPIGIFHQGSKIANRGTDWLIWFLAMISANLAVVNFLPIPIVDGGLFVFLIVEKIMGKPLSPRTQSIAQIVGLALIASVFLFVTYHDITRMF